MALIGNAFEEYVSNQISIRQSALAEGLDPSSPRSLNAQKAFNTQTPWMRLASAVDVDSGGDLGGGPSVSDTVESKGIFSGFDWKGSELSKNFVLLGGAASIGGDTSTGTMPSGIVGKKGALEGAYGYGYSQADLNTGRGYIPPPGVTSVDFEYKNDGALAFATINIKAFSEVQFNIIDILYQRPGYTCLLEFGHSTYLNNSGEVVVADFNTDPLNYLYKPAGSTTYFDLAKKIQNEKSKRQGNYEGMFGIISKFNWKFNSDGSYDITVKLTGTGDVISSLKTNTPKLEINGNAGRSFINSSTLSDSDQPSDKDKEDAEEEGGGAVLIAAAGKSQLNFELFNFFQNTTDYPFSDNSSTNDIKFKNVGIGKKSKSFTIKKALFKIDVNDYGGTEYSPITSIKFGALLTTIQKVCNLKDSKGQHLLNFSMVEELSEGKDTTFMVSYPGNFSSNPTKCIIKYRPLELDQLNTKMVQLPSYTVFNDKLTANYDGNENFENPQLVMRLSDVYVDVGFIATVLEELGGSDDSSRDEVEVPLLGFLNKILSTINSCLGGLNNFRVMFDETTNKINIISESPVLNIKEDNSLTRINTFGIEKNQGSFIKDMDLNSELTDAFATQISIGAQANSNTTAGDGGPFGAYNKGLNDRLMVQKQTPSDGDDDVKEKSELKDVLGDMWTDEVSTAFKQVYGDREFGTDYIPTLEGVVSNMASYIMGRYVQTGNAPVQSFLPFNLSLTMHGLGGMKIYQGFQIDGKGLPVSYDPSTISLIIKSLTHNVSLEGWVTKVETLSKPKTKTTVPASTGKYSAVVQGPPPSGDSAGSGNIPPPGKQKAPEDEKVRIILRRLCDDGAQTLGIMSVFDESGNVLYNLATSELPWKGNKNSISCIPPNDTYRVKSHTSGKHGKCFWLIGNGNGGYKFDKLYGNGYVRGAVLIHKAPIAPGWLEGCIAPGLKFNQAQSIKYKKPSANDKTNPLGTGSKYLDPAKAQSQQAVNKLLETLYAEGSYLMVIKNLGDVGEGQLPKSFNDPQVQNYINANNMRKSLIA